MALAWRETQTALSRVRTQFAASITNDDNRYAKRSSTVVYWPPTRPSCQNRKCTYVNNRCIQSRNIRIWPWLSRGCIEYEIVMLTGRRWGVKLLYNPGERKFKSVGEKMLEWRPCHREAGPSGPRLSSPGERERNAVMAIRVGVNMLQFCSASNSLSHTTLSIKWEVYFSKRPVFARLHCVVMFLHAYVLCGYTTTTLRLTVKSLWRKPVFFQITEVKHRWAGSVLRWVTISATTGPVSNLRLVCQTRQNLANSYRYVATMCQWANKDVADTRPSRQKFNKESLSV